MTTESMLRRMDCLKRAAARRKKCDFWRGDTDRSSLTRRLRAGYSLLIYFGGTFFLTWKHWLNPAGGIWNALVFPVLVLGFIVFLIWDNFRIRWAVKAFDEFRVENVKDLPGS